MHQPKYHARPGIVKLDTLATSKMSFASLAVISAAALMLVRVDSSSAVALKVDCMHAGVACAENVRLRARLFSFEPFDTLGG